MNLRKQTLINSIGSIVLLGCQWLISILLVRTSGYEDAGVFSLAMSIANAFLAFANYGMRNYQVTDIRKAFLPIQYVLARVILSGLSVLICLAYVWIDGFSVRNAIAVLLYLSYNLSFNISDIMMGNLQLQNHLEINGYSNSLRGVLAFLLFCIMHLLTGDLLLSMAAMSVGSLIVLLVFDIPKHRCFCRSNGQLDWSNIKPGFKIFTACFFVFLTNIIPIIITAVPRREIEKQLGDAMLGIFSSVYTPMVVLNTLIPTILLAMVPGITRLWQEGEIKQLRFEIAKSYLIVVTITIIALLLSLVGGKLFLGFIYGTEIMPYNPLLYTAIVAIGLNCASVCGNYIMIAFGYKAQLACFSIIAMVTALMTSSSMIRFFGIYGGAYNMIAAYSAQVLLQLGMIVYKVRTEV